jgi:hypothetical protein
LLELQNRNRKFRSGEQVCVAALHSMKYFQYELKRQCVPVVMTADLIAAGLQSGWSVLRRPTVPET